MGEVAVVCERIKTWARTSEITRAGSLPCVDTSNINELILIECRERNAARTALSFLLYGFILGGFLFVEMPFQEARILEGPLRVRAQCLSCSGKD